ncbi:hypothetical protein [Sulfitobacter sp.]|uniref:hypothetical protein n=1 Tax=Sulfitobacter sp. TaxID=1903071 RepID=UPI0030015ECB
MHTFTKNMAPWRLRDGKPTEEGALKRDEILELRDQFGLDVTALRRLSRKLDMALSKELHITQVELGPARIDRGVRELQLAIKELNAVEKKLLKVGTILQGVKFKNMYGHTGMPNPATQRLAGFAANQQKISDFREYLAVMAREAQVFYKGMPDKRLTSDLRRIIVTTSTFNFWDEVGRKLTYTTAPKMSERGGELIDFVNAVVMRMTDPACRLSGEVIKADLAAFKDWPDET